jgi:Protein of unknown function (DUF2877)
MPRVIRVIEVGHRARRVIDGARVATVIAPLARSVYLEIAGELVWLGPPGSTLHARAIVSEPPLDVGDASRLDLAFDLHASREWQPQPLPPTIDRAILAREGRRLVGAIDRVGRPDGFGALLVGRRPDFPLDRPAESARAFLDACRRDDPTAATVMAERLLGLGPGLTPAGDDLVGGAFFVRRLVGGWDVAAATIRERARERTHPISATLLGDLVEGSAHAPLHDLAHALSGGDGPAAIDAAGRLVRIGHSSGWDMLTGFLGALSGCGLASESRKSMA